MPWDDSLSAVHNDDTKVVGRALNAVNFIEVDWASVERRNTNDIRQNITTRKRREDESKKALQNNLLSEVGNVS